MKTVYRRNLPHILPPGATIFVTFRLTDSLPQATIERLRKEREQDEARLPDTELSQQDRREAIYRLRRRYFGKFDGLLDGCATGPTWLKNPLVAAAVIRQIQRLPEAGVLLHSYTLMPNHVHLVLQLPLCPSCSFANLMQRLKGASAREANQLLQRYGPFWQHESYDHVVRDAAELRRINWYVVQNPVKAGLVREWHEWQFSYWQQFDS